MDLFTSCAASRPVVFCLCAGSAHHIAQRSFILDMSGRRHRAQRNDDRCGTPRIVRRSRSERPHPTGTGRVREPREKTPNHRFRCSCRRRIRRLGRQTTDQSTKALVSVRRSLGDSTSQQTIAAAVLRAVRQDVAEPGTMSSRRRSRRTLTVVGLGLGLCLCFCLPVCVSV
jgi:hypothetical protein